MKSINAYVYIEKHTLMDILYCKLADEFSNEQTHLKHKILIYPLGLANINEYHTLML